MYKNHYCRIHTIFFHLLLLSVLIIGFKVDVSAADPSLTQDGEGRYCINNAEDYYKFVDDVHNKVQYNGSTVILTDNIVVEGEDSQYARTFAGTFDGLGHEIDFTVDNKKNSIGVFPFNFNTASVKRFKY